MDIKSFTPTLTHVILKQLGDEESNKFGIIEPNKEGKKSAFFAEVVAVGPEVITAKVGNKILFADYGFDTVKVEEEEYLVGKEENILAFIE